MSWNTEDREVSSAKSLTFKDKTFMWIKKKNGPRLHLEEFQNLVQSKKMLAHGWLSVSLVNSNTSLTEFFSCLFFFLYLFNWWRKHYWKYMFRKSNNNNISKKHSWKTNDKLAAVSICIRGKMINNEGKKTFRIIENMNKSTEVGISKQRSGMPLNSVSFKFAYIYSCTMQQHLDMHF